MENKQIIEFLHIAENLKNNTRHCVTSTNRKESVAEHSWRLSLLVLLLENDLKKEYENLDINKIIRMTIIHDLGEAITGDIPSFLKTEKDSELEDEKLRNLYRTLPDDMSENWLELLEEMLELKTIESKIYKSLDKMEAVLQHNESPLSSWLPLEHELNQTYGMKEAKEVGGKILSLRNLLVDDTKEKLKKGE